MGNATLRQTTGGQNLDQDLRTFLQVDLPKFVTQSKIGNGKFMKTYIMRVESTQVIVKVYLRLPDEDMMTPAKLLTALWNTIPPTKYPNLMPYQMWIRSMPRNKASPAPVYLIRQFFNANLYDRLSTRPFLNELEKYWFIFQLLKCLEICHEHGVVHGDIKPENIMCTTSNWVVLTDFSPFKPVMLPDDDPTDFKYFFDAMARDRCYIAQERFYRHAVEDRWNKSSSVNAEQSTNRLGRRQQTSKITNEDTTPKQQLTPAMDVFSVGCVMAEIMMDGTPLFDLPGMLQYVSSPLESLTAPSASGKRGEDATAADDISAKQLLSRIKNVQLKAVISSMTRKDADKRLSASDYLKILQGKIAVQDLNTASEESGNNSPKAPRSSAPLVDDLNIPAVLPDYFESCIYPLFLKMHWNGVTPDDRVSILCENYDDIIRHICGIRDVHGAQFFSHAKTNAPLVLSSLLSLENRAHEILLPSVGLELKPASSSTTVSGGADGAASGSGTSFRTKPRSVEERSVLARALPKQKGAAAASSSSELWTKTLTGESVLKDHYLLNHQSSANTNNNNGTQNNDANTGRNSRSGLFSSAISPQPTNNSNGNSSNNRPIAELLDLARRQIAELESFDAALLASEALSANEENPDAKDPEIDTDTAASIRTLQNEYLHTLDQLQSVFSAHPHPNLRSRHPDAPANPSEGGFFFFNARMHDQDAADIDDEQIHAQHEGLVLVVDILCANYRHLKLMPSRALSLLLLGRMGSMCADSVVLQRIAPILLIACEDPAPAIKILALRALTALTAIVEHLEPIEVSFFPQYAFHTLSRVAKDSELVVKMAFAECLGVLANTAKKFLVRGHLMHAEKILRESGVQSGDEKNSNVVLDFSYDNKLESLKEYVSRWIRDLIVEPQNMPPPPPPPPSTGNNSNNNSNSNNNNSRLLLFHNRSLLAPEAAVKKVLLAHIMDFCTFFGQESTMDKLLTQLLTFLNDQDWELRHAFCRQIPFMGAFLGLTVTTEYIVPCLENVIYDVEEKVAHAAMTAITSLVQARLVSKYWLLDFLRKAKVLLLHPATSLRQSALLLFVAASQVLGAVDTAVFLLPELQPLLLASYSPTTTSPSPSDAVSPSSPKAKTLPVVVLKPGQGVLQCETLELALIAPMDLATLREELVAQLTLLSSGSNNGANTSSSASKKKADGDLQRSNSYNNANSSSSPVRVLSEAEEVEVQRIDRLRVLMQPYTLATAREIYTKSLRWRSSNYQQQGSHQGISSASANASSNNSNILVPFLGDGSMYMEQARGSIARLALTPLPTPSTATSSSIADSATPASYANASSQGATSAAGANGGASSSAASIIAARLQQQRQAPQPPPSIQRTTTANATAGATVTATTPSTVVQPAQLQAQQQPRIASVSTTLQWYQYAASFDAHLLTISVPTMRAATGILEELRRQNIYLDNDEERNLLKIRTLFLGNNSNLNQRTNATEGGMMDTGGANSSAYGGENTPVPAVGSYGANNGYYDGVSSAARYQANNIDTYNHSNSNNFTQMNPRQHYHTAHTVDSVTLLRRLRALQIPPIPVDFGPLLCTSDELKLLLETNNAIASGLLSASALEAAGLALEAQSQGSSSATATAANSSTVGAPYHYHPNPATSLRNVVAVAAAASTNGVSNVNSVLAAASQGSSVSTATVLQGSGAGSAAAAGSSSISTATIGGIVIGSNSRANNSGGGVGGGVGGGAGGGVREREGVLMMTLREHAQAVNRLVVAPDMSYFCSASADATVKVWQTRMLDRVAFPRSVGTYAGHNGSVTDAVAIENSHSIASCAKDGTVHVWRVDMQFSSTGNAGPNPVLGNAIASNNNLNANSNHGNTHSSQHHSFLQPNHLYSQAYVSGASLIRVINPREGQTVAVSHFHNDVSSVVLFATQKGGIHGWDLRQPKECFHFHLAPDLGYLSALTVGPDRHWVAAGTSTGVVALWDVRYNVLAQAWRHSSQSAINRLACCKAPKTLVPGLGYTEGVYLFAASGNNEAAIFGLPEAGECLKCFRAVPMNDSRGPAAPLPSLTPLPLPRLPTSSFSAASFTRASSASSSSSLAALLTPPTSSTSQQLLQMYTSQYTSQSASSHGTSSSALPPQAVRAMLGRVSAVNSSHLVTAGTDRSIRFWDFQQPAQCFSIAGAEPTQPRAQFRAVQTEHAVDKLLVCYTPAAPSTDKILRSQLPLRENRGLGTPSVNFRDSILDLKDIELPQRLLMASSRDGEIKLWKVVM